MRPEEDSTGKLTTMKFFGAEIDRVVFFGSAVLLLPFMIFGALFPICWIKQAALHLPGPPKPYQSIIYR